MKNINKSQIVNGICLTVVSTLILSGYLLFCTMFSDNNINDYYGAKSCTVYFENEELCIIENESILEDTLAQIKNEYISTHKTNADIVSNIKVVESISPKEEIISGKELYLRLKNILDIKSIAYGISVNGNLIGALKTKDNAVKLVNDIKKYFTRDYDDNEIIDASFNESVSIEKINIEHNQISDIDELKDYIITGTDENVLYTAKSGDTYWDIADKHNMSVDELFSANPEAVKKRLMPDDVLNLKVPTPIIKVNVKHKVSTEEKIDFTSEILYVSYMYSDQQKIHKPGVYGKADVEYIVTEQNGIELSRHEISRNVISEPEAQILLIGTQTPPPRIGTGFFANPLAGSTFSSAFGQRGGILHRGIDLAKAIGSDIKAADGGTVTYAGWYSTYGYLVEIDHGGGWTTRYAHCSQMYVKKGDKVYQGQVIAAVGNTGDSTGPHLHFEVRKYGSLKNPSDYIGKQYN